nr:MAG TPA: hypothetical protein [Caudoviricetes sp.]
MPYLIFLRFSTFTLRHISSLCCSYQIFRNFEF